MGLPRLRARISVNYLIGEKPIQKREPGSRINVHIISEVNARFGFVPTGAGARESARTLRRRLS